MHDISYEICSLIFLSILLIFYYNRKHTKDILSSVFGRYMLFVVAEVIFRILASVLSLYGTVIPFWLHEVVSILGIVSQYFVPLVFFGYYYFLYKEQWDYRNIKEWLYILPGGLGLVLLLFNQKTQLYYWYDADMVYHKGWGFFLIYVSAIIYFLLSVFMVKKRSMQDTRVNSIILVPITGALMMLVELFVPDLSLFGLCCAVCTLITYLVFENPIDYISKHTGILNRAAFQKMMNSHKEKNVTAMYVITLDDFKLVNNILGSEEEDKILHGIAQRLVVKYQMNNVFWLGNGTFVVIQRTEEPEIVAEQLKVFIAEAGSAEDTRVLLNAGICKIKLSDWLWTEIGILRMVDNASAAVRAMGRGVCIEFDQSLFGAIRRQEAIEQAIIEAIEQERLEVYYQPLYAQEKKVYQSLEALSRLQVEGYGYIPPDEFIEIAERNGSIVQLGLLVLKKVCQCIKQHDLRQKGIRFVEVNASMVQCIQEHFAEDVLAVLKEYDIEPSMLCLEVTESAMTQSQERLTRNMNTLREAGVFFALDDYGSGYSNINYIVDLPFSIIKLDKYLVWAAFTNENSRNILEYTILMFRRIALEIVAEGIENQYQAQTLSNAGVEYFQGYLYAKPLPEEKLIAFLEEHMPEVPDDSTLLEELFAQGQLKEADEMHDVVEEETTEESDFTQNIALCMSELQQEEASEFVASLCEETKAAGYRLLVFNTLAALENQDNYTKGEESIYALLNLKMLSALVIMPELIRSKAVLEGLVKRAKESNVPVILLNHNMEDCYSIWDDGETAFEAIVRHVVERHSVQNVRLVAGAHWSDYYNERIRIFQTVLQEYGILFADDQILCSDVEENKVGAMLDNLLKQGKEMPQAFVCMDDMMAMLLCGALEQRGYHVPEDVLVTGFAGVETVYCTPRLTTAVRDAKKVAETMTEIVLALKQGYNLQQIWKIPYKICYSQSCGCEPVSIVDATERMKNIYHQMHQNREFEKQMYRMISELTDNHTLKEYVKLLEPYIMKLACDYVAICVKEDYITWLNDKEDTHSRPTLDHAFTGRMYRIACKKKGRYHKDFVAFAAKKMLPVQDQVESEAWKLVFLPLHFQDSVLGYVSFGFLEGTKEYAELLGFYHYLSQIFTSISKHTEEYALIEEDKKKDVQDKTGVALSQISGLYDMLGFQSRVEREMMELMGMYAEAAVVCIGLNVTGVEEQVVSDSIREEALVVLAQALIRCSKGEAITAHTGDDEFTVLFVTIGTSELKARAFVEQVKQQLKLQNIAEQLFTVDFSYGITTSIIDMDFHVEAKMEEASRVMREAREEQRIN